MESVVEAGDRKLSAQAVADELGVAERTVRRWIRSGRLTAEKRASSYVISLQEARQIHAQAPLGRSDRSRIRQDRELMELRAAHESQTGELMELRGRYREVAERLARIEAELIEERRARTRLEVLLEKRAA